MIEKVFPATDESLPLAIGLVEEELERLDCPLKGVMQITVCVEEMFVNVAHYAYQRGDGDGNVTMRLDDADGVFTITLIDSGYEFDPLAKPDPDITLGAEERGIGGLGIYMVKKTMDSVAYERRDNLNIFTMSKKL